MRVSLGAYPSPKRLMSLDLSDLSGGLNLYDIPYRVAPNQSPNLKNVLWEDGALRSRYGTELWANYDGLDAGFGVAMYEDLTADKLYANMIFVHVDEELVMYDRDKVRTHVTITSEDAPNTEIWLPFRDRGTFFRYKDYLYYKAKDIYIRIEHDGKTAHPVTGPTPTILINANPKIAGAGDPYQPENRLSKKKTVWYNATVAYSKEITESVRYTFMSMSYESSNPSKQPIGVTGVYVNGIYWSKYAVTVNPVNDAGKSSVVVDFIDLPDSDQARFDATIIVEFAQLEHHLPVTDVDSVDRVEVDGKELTSAEYTVDLKAGVVTLKKAAPITTPPTNNTVRITYSKSNPQARRAIMDCSYVTTYGADQSMCILMAGSEKQPNAYFWNGNTDLGMDPGYFPIDAYNLAGATDDMVTGFARQHSDLIIFTAGTIGKSRMDTTKVGTRDVITFPYIPINDRIGCDFPWSICSVQNNTVFVNKKTGVNYLANTTPANENNVYQISRNVNGGADRPGLLRDISDASYDVVFGYDDGDRYWVTTPRGRIYLWAYHLNDNPTDEQRLSWFLFTDIYTHSILKSRVAQATLFSNDFSPGIGAFTPNVYSDYGEPIDKLYEFSVQDLGGYFYLKDIVKVILTVKSKTNSIIDITYENDYGNYTEPTPIRAWMYSFIPRDLSFRCLSTAPFAEVAIRQPGYRNIRHFSMSVHNKRVGDDMTILSCQIFYNTQGRDR